MAMTQFRRPGHLTKAQLRSSNHVLGTHRICFARPLRPYRPKPPLAGDYRSSGYPQSERSRYVAQWQMRIDLVG